MSDLLDWRPVLRGAGVAAAIAVVIGLSLGLVSDTSNYGFAAFALIMVGMGIGGFVGARPQTDVAFTAGAASSFLASLAAQALSLVVQLAKGTDLPAGYLFGAVFTLLISTSFGVLGGYVALRRDRPANPSAEEAPT
jgi:hypothetical protein